MRLTRRQQNEHDLGERTTGRVTYHAGDSGLVDGTDTYTYTVDGVTDGGDSNSATRHERPTSADDRRPDGAERWIRDDTEALR